MSHGSNQFDPVVPRSRFYHGRFGRLFPALETWDPRNGSKARDSSKAGKDPQTILEEQCLKHAKEMVEEGKRQSADIAGDPKLRQELDKKFDSTIPAGYTYFGQFVDHDLTFRRDTAS